MSSRSRHPLQKAQARGRAARRASQEDERRAGIRLVVGLLAAFVLALVIDVWAFSGPATSPALEDGEGSGASANGSLAGPAASESSVDAALARLSSAGTGEGSAEVLLLVAGEVPDVALDLLDAYRRQHGTSLLAHEGYLDLSGRVWGCVVQGESWVDIGVVRAGDEEQSSLSLVRLDVETWAEEGRDEGWVVDDGS